MSKLTDTEWAKLDELAREADDVNRRLRGCLLGMAVAAGPTTDDGKKLALLADRATDFPAQSLFTEWVWAGNNPDGTGRFTKKLPSLAGFPAE